MVLPQHPVFLTRDDALFGAYSSLGKTHCTAGAHALILQHLQLKEKEPGACLTASLDYVVVGAWAKSRWSGVILEDLAFRRRCSVDAFLIEPRGNEFVVKLGCWYGIYDMEDA